MTVFWIVFHYVCMMICVSAFDIIFTCLYYDLCTASNFTYYFSKKFAWLIMFAWRFVFPLFLFSYVHLFIWHSCFRFPTIRVSLQISLHDILFYYVCMTICISVSYIILLMMYIINLFCPFFWFAIALSNLITDALLIQWIILRHWDCWSN